MRADLKKFSTKGKEGNRVKKGTGGAADSVRTNKKKIEKPRLEK